ncbi:hypothetical protein [Agrobacterium tumefaciens]|uniref:hypothetical protein n=1 Tax=Agrobacterium tumefaciens TaxID=358 RepID=UPI003BA19686
MGEQRFKVGDWVRVIDNRGAPTDYKKDDVFQVTAVRDDLVFSEGKPGMFAKRFEPWQPRVGERVRVARAELQHKSAAIGLEFTVTNEAYKVGNGVQTWGGDKAGGFVWRADELEPILAATPEKPTTLKIEAGKFYKTRDGRKVGPIVVAQGRGKPWPWKSCYGWNTYYFKEDGFSCPGSIHGHRDADDIIAEWIDEPEAKASTTAASNDNAKPKFKVGDRVEITANDNYRVNFVGSFGTIKTAPANAVAGFRVQLDDGREFPFWPSEMTVRSSSAQPTTIVALIENGQPKPSSTPHVHTSAEAAEKEAKRLSAKYKGKKFGVFTLTATYEEAVPVYDHKWQNMAALGLKIDAIKELRAVAGLTLKGAKDAVEAWIEYENAA